MKHLLLPFTLSISILAGCAQQPSSPDLAQQQPDNLPGVDSVNLEKHSEQASASVIVGSQQVEPATLELSIDVWQKIALNPGFARNIDNSKVEKYRNWYTGKQRYFDRIGSRAQLYMAHIIEELQRNDLPLELALLPFVESAYNPFAYSPSGAAGLWQFMRPTGDHLGLIRDSWYDGRRDVISSTTAAVRYFKYLNKRFDGDWLLTLAAYNAGEGTLKKAIRANLRKGKPTDFWSLRLPAETRAYVPKLIALAQVTASPADYNLALPSISTEVHFEIIDLPEMSIDGVYRLNPGCQQSATPPQGPHRLLIPRDKAASFESRLSSTPRDHWLKIREYKVAQDDTLSEIAQRHRLSVKSLMAQNKMVSSRIRVGQVLKIPSIGHASLPSFARPTQYYRVRQGDSLWKIAHAYQVKTLNLARWNGLNPKAPLKIGKRLKIRAPALQTPQGKLSYKIRKGDSLSEISKQFKVSVNDIVRWNKLNKEGFIKAGQTLRMSPRS
mgnify:CR=1 FL=1